MNMLMDRSKNNEKLPKVYCFNTFFYGKIVSQGHSSVKRWTRKVWTGNVCDTGVHCGMIHIVFDCCILIQNHSLSTYLNNVQWADGLFRPVSFFEWLNFCSYSYNNQIQILIQIQIQILEAKY